MLVRLPSRHRRTLFASAAALAGAALWGGCGADTTMDTAGEPVGVAESAVLPSADCSAGRVLVMVAHNDDDLYFIEPWLSKAMDAGKCLRTIYITGAYRSTLNFSERERGDEAGYAKLAGLPVKTGWDQETQSFAGKPVLMKSLLGRPNITVGYLRLKPDLQDGATSDTIRVLHDSQVPTTVSSYVPGSSSYTADELRQTLAAIMTQFDPTEIHTLNPDAQSCTGAYCDEHPDHVSAARFVREAAAIAWPPPASGPVPPAPPVYYHQTYPTELLPFNVAPRDAYRKIEALAAYFGGEDGTYTPYEGVYEPSYNGPKQFLREVHTQYPANAPPAVTPAYPTFKLHDIRSGTCAQPGNASNGAGIWLTNCIPANEQQWILEAWGGIRNAVTQKCLQAGASVISQQPCDSTLLSQKWIKSNVDGTLPGRYQSAADARYLVPSDLWWGGQLALDLSWKNGMWAVGDKHAFDDIRAELPLMGDFDGDGKKDLLVLDAENAQTPRYGTEVPAGPGAQLRVYPAVGGEWAAKPLAPSALMVRNLMRPLVGDFDGDGKSDVMLAVGHALDDGMDLWFVRSVANGFDDPVHWRSLNDVVYDQARFTVGNFDGDNKDDVLVMRKRPADGGFDLWMLKSTGSGFADPALWWSDPGLPFANARLDAGRFDAGLESDVLITSRDADGGATLWVQLSNGSGFAPRVMWSPLDGFAYDWMRVKVGDVTGDGLSDVVIAHKHGNASGFNLWTLRSTGSTFAYRALWQSFMDTLRYSQMLFAVGDVDGDGKADVMVTHRDPDPAIANWTQGTAVPYTVKSNGSSFGAPVAGAKLTSLAHFERGVWYSTVVERTP